MSELDIVYCILSEQKLQDEQIDTESIPYPNFFTREAVKNTKRGGGPQFCEKRQQTPEEGGEFINLLQSDLMILLLF